MGCSTHNAQRVVLNAVHTAKLEGRQMHLGFIDFKNAYDSVNHDALERAMRAVGLYEADVRLARAMLANQSHRCVTAHGLTNRVSGWGPSGVAQGATESPLLFGIMLEPLLRELDMHCREHGFNIGSTTVCVQAYADSATWY